jgi:Zn finger protein HypA/HybF involved in hydrogenase expression
VSNEDVTQHAHGPAQCDDCGHKWVAVWPLGAEALECPKCHGTNTDRDAS